MTGNKTIVIAEDEKIYGKILKERLESEGFKIIWVLDGEEALKTVEREKPDLLILDLLMPQKGGFEVLRTITQNLKTTKLKAIVISNLNQEAEIKKSQELGVCRFIVKSDTSLEEVIEAIKAELI